MKKKDILVGRTYTNSAYPDIVYLGVAVREHKFIDKPAVRQKELVIIKSREHRLIGSNVICTKDRSNQEFWSQFRLTETN